MELEFQLTKDHQLKWITPQQHLTNPTEWNTPHDIQTLVSSVRLFVQGSGLLQQSLSFAGFSSNRAESLDSQSLTSLADGCGPSSDVLEVLLSGSVGLLGDDLSVLVLHQVGLLQSTNGFYLGSTVYTGFTSLS